MPLFSTLFVPPPALTGFAIFANVPESGIEMEWTSTALGADFGGYRVSRSLDGGATWVLLEHITSEATVAYTDYTAGLDRDLLYRMTVSSLDFESEPVQAATRLNESTWRIVRPGDPSLTFELRYVEQEDDVREIPRERFYPMGRSRPVVVSGTPMGRSGSLDVTIAPQDFDLEAKVQAAAEIDSGPLMLKLPTGEVWNVRLGPIKRRRAGGRVQSLDVPFVEVD